MSTIASAKAAGRHWETACSSLLNLFFPGTERRRQRGVKDAGDLIPGKGLEDWTVECKAEKRIDLAGYMTEVEAEQKWSGTKWGVALVKRRQKPVIEGYAVMPIHTWVDVCKELAYLRLTSTPDEQ
jgi:hypothetical protein